MHRYMLLMQQLQTHTSALISDRPCIRAAALFHVCYISTFLVYRLHENEYFGVIEFYHHFSGHPQSVVLIMMLRFARSKSYENSTADGAHPTSKLDHQRTKASCLAQSRLVLGRARQTSQPWGWCGPAEILRTTYARLSSGKEPGR